MTNSRRIFRTSFPFVFTNLNGQEYNHKTEVLVFSNLYTVIEVVGDEDG